MKLAYKAFDPGLKCRGYQFNMGLNTTTDANCARNGFHCAENPIDCLSYYPYVHKSVYCLVGVGGDIDEDSCDSKIAATELKILRILSLEDYFLHILIYLSKHPNEHSSHITEDCGEARCGYAVVRGKKPMAKGKLGDVLAFLKLDRRGKPEQIAVFTVDGEEIKEDTYYDVDGKEVSFSE